MVCTQCQVIWPDNNRQCQYCGRPLLTKAQADLAAAQTPQAGRISVIQFLVVFFIELRQLTLFEYLSFLGLMWFIIITTGIIIMNVVYGYP